MATPIREGRSQLTPRIAVVVFVITSLAFTGWALANGQTLGGTEILELASPYREDRPEPSRASNPLQTDQMEQLALVAEFWASARQGDLQLWEPDIGTGVPMFTAVHNRVLTPFFIVFLVVPAALGTTVAIALGLFVAQLSTYGLARRLHLGVGGSMFAGVGYAFSGPVIALLLRINEALLLPALLFAVHGAMTEGERRGRYLALASVTTAGIWFCGFPAAGLFVAYLSLAFVAYLAIASARVDERPVGRIRRSLVRTAPTLVALGAGTLIAAVQLLPTLEFLGRSGALDRRFDIWHSAGLVKLASAVSGRFFGAYQDHDWWWPELGLSNPVEAGSTMGLIALGLMITAAVRGRRCIDRFVASDPLGGFFLPAGVVVLVGVYLGGPVLGLFHQLPFLASNSFTRSRFILALVVALTAGAGLDVVGRPGRVTSRTFRVATAAIVIVVAIGTYEGITEAARLDELASLAMDMIVPVAALGGAGLVVAVWKRRGGAQRLVLSLTLTLFAAAELQWGGWGFVAGSSDEIFYPRHRAFEAIADQVGTGGLYRFAGMNLSVAPPNAAAYNDLNDLRISYPSTGRFRELLEVADPRVFEHRRLRTVFSEELDVRSHVLDRAATRYLVAALKAPILEVEDTQVVDVQGSTRLPVEGLVGRTVRPVRALRFVLHPADDRCRDGWVVLKLGDIESRRLLREIDGGTNFPLPDVQSPTALPFELRSTSCPVHLGEPSGEALLPAPASPVKLVGVDGWVVYERADALPRVHLAEQVARIDEDEDRLQFLAARSTPEPVVVSGGGNSGPLSGGRSQLVEDGDDRVVIDVDSEGPGLLVLRDAFAPGWQVSVDGQSEELIEVDHAFRGVEVPPGQSRVIFRYSPRSLRIGAVLMVIGLMLTFLLWRWGGASQETRGTSALKQMADTSTGD